MRLKLIACKALYRELAYVTAFSENIVDVTWLRQGYHSRPEKLRELLQKEIDDVESGTDSHTNRICDRGEGSGVADDFDAILLGYGLCSNSTTGISAKHHRLVIPKAHDCITFFLGSKELYASYFQSIPGCYWFTASWIENTNMPGEKSWARMRQVFKEKGYDDETIDYLLTESGGLNNYSNIGYIRMPFLDRPSYRQISMDAAKFFGWNFHEIEGKMDLLQRFIDGDWDEKDFLVLEPGEIAAQSYDDDVIKKAE